MRLIFVLWVFLPALIYGSLIPEHVWTRKKTTDLSDSSKPREGKEKEISEDEKLGRKDCDGPVTSMISQGLMTEKGCVCNSDGVLCPMWKCNVQFCACKSKDTGKRIDFEC